MSKTNIYPDLKADESASSTPNPVLTPFTSTGLIATTVESFDGRNVKEYFRKLEIRARLDNWTQETTLDILIYRLSGDAYKFFWADDKLKDQTYDELKQTFIKKFSPTKIPGEALIRLSKSYQRFDEKISTYVTRLKSIGHEILTDDLKLATSETQKDVFRQKANELVLNQFRIGIHKQFQNELLPTLMRTENLTLEKAEELANHVELTHSICQNRSNNCHFINQQFCQVCKKNNHSSQNCRFKTYSNNNNDFSPINRRPNNPTNAPTQKYNNNDFHPNNKSSHNYNSNNPQRQNYNSNNFNPKNTQFNQRQNNYNPQQFYQRPSNYNSNRGGYSGYRSNNFNQSFKRPQAEPNNNFNQNRSNQHTNNNNFQQYKYNNNRQRATNSSNSYNQNLN
ncbi:GATA zinc finger domain-containing protein 14-like [Photinus pyralis]|uniref:GATA zinc finger domain-containing protein 14-like n=1 Tax=Photinus pyralis TaxID=7054 RepID=UPI00126749DF|nr:GATA zinc finger domain-containing protein 14-like [Photinus pyralis]